MAGRGINTIACVARTTSRTFSTIKLDSASRATAPEDSSVFDRLARAYKALSNSNKSFRHSSYDTFKLYKNAGTSLLEDIFKYPRINQDLMDLICMNYWKSGSLRSIVLQNLIKISKDQRPELLMHILYNLELRAIKGTMEVNGMSELHEGLLKVLILACSSGEPLIGSLILLQLAEEGYNVSDDIVHGTIDCLICYKGPLLPHYIYTVLRLLHTFQYVRFQPRTLYKILEFSLADDGAPLYANLIYDTITRMLQNHKQQINIEEMGEIGNIVKVLLNRNVKFSMHNQVIKIWQEQSDTITSLAQDSRLLEQIIMSIPKHYASIIVTSLNRSQSTKHLEVLLKFYSKDENDNELRSLMKLVKPPVSRAMLSILLKLMMKENKEKDSEKVLDAIFKSKNGLSDADIDTIVSSTLRKGNYKQVAKTISGVEPEIAVKAVISVIEYIFRSNLVDQLSGILNNVTVPLSRLTGTSYNARLLTSVIGFLIKRHGPRCAMAFYVSLNRHEFEKSTNPTAVILQQNGVSPKLCEFLLSYLVQDPSGLLLILSASMKVRDVELLKPCIDELQAFGFTHHEILSCCKEAHPGVYEEFFDDKVKALLI